MKQIPLTLLLLIMSVSGNCLAQTGQGSINCDAADTAHHSSYNMYRAKYPRINLLWFCSVLMKKHVTNIRMEYRNLLINLASKQNITIQALRSVSLRVGDVPGMNSLHLFLRKNQNKLKLI